ncbi:hypothetical protein MJO28_000150 [Puccinia striiformis f. sp. tritici]|uniref:Uncharacterized protein n=2 Tax=Puccinia striiformis TaxID=27350 RepID=A0A2S4UKD8_9BASI|nr:hypothetical protein Pst134EA_001065 [Puccinia striiformis f. sp. tritici]KAH9474010.1 hypothetical protein Pst134EA_001065 [Puccinia striiformis f. sp. tritici]KAI7962056.1 hypothetical protein MJO28_000150 [Puccinia striiformis f. sp. tritici]POV97671.1 hypothetical protein PSTT_14918 [Puccinia striiformis]
MAINIRNSGLVFYFMVMMVCKSKAMELSSDHVALMLQWEAETPTLDDILYHTNVRARQSELSLTHAETFHHSQKGEDQGSSPKVAYQARLQQQPNDSRASTKISTITIPGSFVAPRRSLDYVHKDFWSSGGSTEGFSSLEPTRQMAQSIATATIDPSTLNEDLKMATDFPRIGNRPYSIVSAGLEARPHKKTRLIGPSAESSLRTPTDPNQRNRLDKNRQDSASREPSAGTDTSSSAGENLRLFPASTASSSSSLKLPQDLQGSSMMTSISGPATSNHFVPSQRPLNELSSKIAGSERLGLRFDRDLFSVPARQPLTKLEYVSVGAIVKAMDIHQDNQIISSENEFPYYHKLFLRVQRTFTPDNNNDYRPNLDKKWKDSSSSLRDAYSIFLTEDSLKVWYKHWHKQTNINFRTHIDKFTDLPDFEEIFPILLFYVEMISSVIPRPEDQIELKIESIMKSAIASCEFLTRQMKNRSKKEDQKVQELAEHLLRKMEFGGRSLYPQMVWLYLEFWLKTDRNQLYQRLCSNNALVNNFKQFFNLIFQHSYFGLTQRYA